MEKEAHRKKNEWERQRMDFGSKLASSGAKPPMKRQIKVDEDEGSPLQNGVNSLGFRYAARTRARLLNQREKKIERSAEALRVRHTRHIFPSKDNPAYNTREQSRGQKGWEWQKCRY
jgi:hypothetical protein